MLRKMSARRRAAFLRALEGCGNVTLAAERACVSRGWVLKARRGEPEFDAACAAAIAAAAERLGASGGNRVAATGWGTLDGVQLVVRGSNRRRMQIARARAHQWTPAVEKRFLAVLAATCNVKAALAEVGMSKGSAYTHRKRWQAFADKWDAAIEEGYAVVELALLQNAQNLFSPDEYPVETPLLPMSVAEAIQLLHMHKHHVHGIGKAPGDRWRRPPTLDEVAPGIWRKFEILERGRGVSEKDKAQGERQWARRRETGDG